MKKIRSARSKEKTEKRVSVNFTPTEYAHFLTMKEERVVSQKVCKAECLFELQMYLFFSLCFP